MRQKVFTNNPSNCKLRAYNYANQQNTYYDEDKNEILYGISNRLKASGVSDGTCNQINPLMLRYQARCGVGAAGGNPCFPNTIEPFDSESKPCNMTASVVLLFLVLIFILFININYYDTKN
jgi:hypothetical protein